MNFAETMGKFFSRYSMLERQEVEQSLAYQEAANAEDVEKAQRIACEIIEGGGRTRRDAKEDRQEKRFDRLLRQFEE